MARRTQDILNELAALQPQIRKDTTIEDLVDKAKDREGALQKKGKVQVGAVVDESLWREVKVKAAMEGQTAGQILQDALYAYLGKEPPDQATAKPGPKPANKSPTDTTEAERIIMERASDDARNIAHYLNSLGITTARGREWSVNTVNKARLKLRKAGAI